VSIAEITTIARGGPRVAGAGERTLRVVERNVRAYRRYWVALLTGFLEPVILLLSLGLGVGELVGKLPGPGGQRIPYDQFVAPAMMANAAMNGAIFDTTFNFFSKFKYGKTYDGMLATPLNSDDIARGEVAWALGRGAVYATGFLLVMVAFGLVESWWAVLTVPVAVLVGFAFAGMGLGATTYMRSFLDFDKVGMAIVPLFLFSATFFPLSRYPDAVAWVVRFTPLYQGVVLCRSLTLGDIHASLLLNALYLAVVGYAGTRLASHRIAKLLQP
jgi:lipooligosaccharide transport system permease protein